MDLVSTVTAGRAGGPCESYGASSADGQLPLGKKLWSLTEKEDQVKELQLLYTLHLQKKRIATNHGQLLETFSGMSVVHLKEIINFLLLEVRPLGDKHLCKFLFSAQRRC